MTSIRFTNVKLLDGTGAPPFDAEVLVEANRIAAVERGGARAPRPDVEVIDGGGGTLMPGLADCHAHLSFANGFNNPAETADIPPEEHTLLTAGFAKLYLDQGFTSCFGGAAAKQRIDVAIRNAIDAGDIPGPRFLAAGLQISPTSGFGDERLSHYDNGAALWARVCDGPDEFRRVAREACRDGVDVIKIIPSASALDWGRHPLDEDTVMTDEEVAAVTGVAKERHRRVAAHARSAESVKMCVRHGVDMIYHATLADEEARDMLEASKDRLFVGPAIGLPASRLDQDAGLRSGPHATPVARLEAEIETTSECMRDLHKRGVRVVTGGDYGFTSNPHGRNARDIEHFVELIGMSPMEAICAATAHAGDMMGLPGELGLIREGYLADLLLVDGDPLADVAILQDAGRLTAIMKDGVLHKCPAAAPAWRQAAE